MDKILLPFHALGKKLNQVEDFCRIIAVEFKNMAI
jgi:hypothetical protein